MAMESASEEEKKVPIWSGDPKPHKKIAVFLTVRAGRERVLEQGGKNDLRAKIGKKDANGDENKAGRKNESEILIIQKTEKHRCRGL